MVRTSGLVLALCVVGFACGDQGGGAGSASAKAEKPGSAAPKSTGSAAATAKPTATASSTAGTSAAASASAAPPRAEDPKAQAALKDIKITDKAELDVAPKDGVYANIYGKFITLDRIEISGDKEDWSISAKESAGAGLGVYFRFKEADAKKKKFGKALKYGDGYFQVPKDPKGPLPGGGTGFTTSLNADNAYNVELTKFEPGTFQKPGECSGRFTVWYKSDDGPLFATGTFDKAKCHKRD
jgi:hypothetical protein